LTDALSIFPKLPFVTTVEAGFIELAMSEGVQKIRAKFESSAFTKPPTCVILASMMSTFFCCDPSMIPAQNSHYRQFLRDHRRWA
jgi:hypothetical protein